MNLETWRQLWRTVEISDIILMIVDVRFAVRSIVVLPFSLSFDEMFFFEGSAFFSNTVRLCDKNSQETFDCHSE